MSGTLHTQDSQCTIDPETNCCRECGVEHADPCYACGGRGFHQDNCAEIDEAAGYQLGQSLYLKDQVYKSKLEADREVGETEVRTEV